MDLPEHLRRNLQPNVPDESENYVSGDKISPKNQMRQDLAAANEQVDPITGSELDSNVEGNLYDKVQKADEPVHPQETENYYEAEGFDDFFDHNREFHAAHAALYGYGVETHPNGPVLRWGDERPIQVDSQGGEQPPTA